MYTHFHGNSGESCPQWYAVEVAPRKEKQVESALAKKGYEVFLPLYRVRKVWSDRIHQATLPLFSGYVFCRFDARVRLPVLMTPGVRQVVGAAGNPEAVPEAELEAIRVAIRNGVNLEPCERLEAGDRVIVRSGSMAGLEGTFVRHAGHARLILSVSLIQRSISVDIDRALVEPIRKAASAKKSAAITSWHDLRQASKR